MRTLTGSVWLSASAILAVYLRRSLSCHMMARLTSDAGGLLLREADRQLGLTRRLAVCLTDPRDPAKVIHEQQTMLAQRIFGIALGYEDLNDYDMLRTDPLFSIPAEQRPAPESPLASSPTLC